MCCGQWWPHAVLYAISEMTLLLLILLKVLHHATYYITRKGIKCSSQHARRPPEILTH